MSRPPRDPQVELPLPDYESLDDSGQSPKPVNQNGVYESDDIWWDLGRNTHEAYPVERDRRPFHTGYMGDSQAFMGSEPGYQNGPHQGQTAWEEESGFISTHYPFLQSARNLRQYLKGLKKERMELQRERMVLQELNSGIEEILQYCRHDARRGTPQPRSSDGRRLHKDRPGRAGCRGHNFPPSYEDVRLALDRYNSAWLEVPPRSFPETGEATLPWPSYSLQANELAQVPPLNRRRPRLPQEITEDIFQLRKWNTFCFFTQACGLRPHYRLVNVEDSDDRTALRLEVKTRGASRVKLEALKSQLVREKLRWHPDRLRRMGIGSLSEQEEEAAKAVWGAVIDASRACERCLEVIP